MPVQGRGKVQKARKTSKHTTAGAILSGGVETVRSGHRFQQDVCMRRGGSGNTTQGTVPENEPVRSQAAVFSANAIPQKNPRHRRKIFRFLIHCFKKEPAVLIVRRYAAKIKRPSASTEHNLAHEVDAEGQSADRVSETNTYTVSKPVPRNVTDKPAKKPARKDTGTFPSQQSLTSSGTCSSLERVF